MAFARPDGARLGLLSGPKTPLWKLDDLFQGDRREVERGYALAGALVQDLLERYGPAVPRIVLARLAQGDSFDQALRGATGTTLVDVGEAFWERQGTLKRWIPILTSTAALWFGISLLAIAAADPEEEAGGEAAGGSRGGRGSRGGGGDGGRSTAP